MIFSKSILLSAVSAVAILAATPAFSADTNPSAGVKSSAAVDLTANSQIKVDDLIGKSVHNARGDAIGDVESVIVDPDGKVAAVIVGVGGFLGLGEHRVALDWNDIRIDGKGDVKASNLTKAQLKAMPEYKYEAGNQRNTAFVDRSYFDRRKDDVKRLAGQASDGIQRAAKSVKDTVKEATSDGKWIAAEGAQPAALVGADVVNFEGDSIGEVEKVATVDNRTMLIVSVGEFLGIGGRTVALETVTAHVEHRADDANEYRVKVSLTKADLEAMPEYKM